MDFLPLSLDRSTGRSESQQHLNVLLSFFCCIRFALQCRCLYDEDMEIRYIFNEQVTPEWFEKMLDMDHAYWPKGNPNYLESSYLRSVFEPDCQGVFLAIDEDRKELIGYFNVIFPSPESLHAYLHGGSFTDLDNRKLQKGENLCYLYTANIGKEYQGSAVLKHLCACFAAWLDEKDAEGCHITKAYGEAVSPAGARMAKHGFGMKPMEDVDSQGLGHYISEDGLKEYRRKMRERKSENESA